MKISSNSNFKDITGNKYNMLTVLGLSSFQKKGNKYWDCLCDCGQKTVLPTCEVKRMLSCGCKNKTAQINITGRRYDMLTVLGFSHTTNTAIRMWKCVCDCGTEVITSYCKLNTSRKTNCGCVAYDKLKNRRFGEGQASFNVLYGNYRRRVERSKLGFNLTKDHFRELTSSNCFYCGEAPKNKQSNQSKTGDYVYNGLDRIDNNLGYLTTNVVPCCTMCNYAKNKHSLADFLDWIDKLFKQKHALDNLRQKLKEERAGENEELF